jgi:cell division septal protein FtsQ
VSPIAAPSDKRFRRAHVKPARRRRWRALGRPLAKCLLAALVTGYGLYRGGAVVAHARVLQVDHIVVRGNRRLSTGEVLAVLDGLRGENLVRTSLDEWRRRLLASPWVEDAALRRSIPSTVEVTLSERSPIGIGRMNHRLYLIDERGVVIDEYGPQYADLDLPIIDGLAARPSEDGQPDEARAELVSRLIAALGSNPEIAKRLSQIDVSDVHNVTVILSGDPAVIYLGDDRFLPRLESYCDLASALRERVPEIDYVDLRFDDRIYVRPMGNVGKPGKAGNTGTTGAAASPK